MCSCRSLHGISVEREPADGEISGLRTNHSPAPSIIAASRQFPTCFDRCHCYLPGCSSLYHDSQPTNATLISSALITSFLRNQIVTRLGKLSHSLIPFQSAPHQTRPLIAHSFSLQSLWLPRCTCYLEYQKSSSVVKYKQNRLYFLPADIGW